MAELDHACGIAAIYHLPGESVSPLAPAEGPYEVSRQMPRMLLNIQNRGQLAAGFSTYRPNRHQILETYKEIGTVIEAFRMSHRAKFESIMKRFAGSAAIGHVRYATCGLDDRSYAQPFERQHGRKWKWFSFAFNGQLTNYPELRQELLSKTDYHLARDTDTEVLMHAISYELRGDRKPDMVEVFRNLSRRFDGAYNIVFLNALGEMVVARDPLGIRPLCYAWEGPLFAAASESVALLNLGFEHVHSVEPGQMIVVGPEGSPRFCRFAERRNTAHCFFEWIYFANVASTLDERSVYLTRTALGEELAKLELEAGLVPLDEDTVVVPVPDTGKAAADAMAFQLKIRSVEGLIRNRYVGRTFIEGNNRADRARMKYTPLREVLEGRRVLLVEDTIVRSTTMKALIEEIRRRGHAREIHVRVACPPIVAPCFYGIDMSTVGELFAPHFLNGAPITDQVEQRMARELGANSLRYLPIEAVARAIGLDASRLCRACITGQYPTPAGQRLYQIAKAQVGPSGGARRRTYEREAAAISSGEST
jgi:amidophosphoribosyltransferase